QGTKAAAVYKLSIGAGDSRTIRLRLMKNPTNTPFSGFDSILEQRHKEADEFYARLQNPDLNDDEKLIQRQSAAGTLWTKQLYYSDVEQWLRGDLPPMPPPPREHQRIRNSQWEHLVNFDVISMPDKWEYPWYAAWDLAFHCIPLAVLDPDFAKRQV